MFRRFLGIYWHLPLVFLGLGELLIIALALVLAARMYGTVPAAIFVPTFLVSCLVSMGALGLYSRRLRARTSGTALRIVGGLASGALLASAACVLLGIDPPPLRTQSVTITLALAAITVLRFWLSHRPDGDFFRRNVLVFGAGERAQSLTQLRRRADLRGFRLEGFVSAEGEPRAIPESRLLPFKSNLLETCRARSVDEIVVAMDDRRRNFPVAELLECRLAGIEITELVSFLERETGKVRLDMLHPSWLIYAQGFRQDALREGTRRLFDVLASLALILVSWPLMVLTALAIKLEDGWRAPVLYRQTRVGLMGRSFDIFKFRSMREDAERDGQARWATTNDDRVTRVGRFIRMARLDELPQIFNVFVGDMSVVGPRPERPEFVRELCDKIPYYRERHYVRPGITGWAQLCYAYGASEEDAIEKLQYDLYYVKNHGLLFDLVILLQTVEVIIFGKGAR